jgi:hypothetical protein
LNDPAIHGEVEVSKQMHKFKARIEFIGDFDDVRKVSEFVKRLSKKE